MIEFTAILIIALLYVIPLNLPLYYLSKMNVVALINSQGAVLLFLKETPVISSIIQFAINIGVAFFYILYVVILFIVIYLVLRFIVTKASYVYLDKEFEPSEFLSKYKQGQRNINAVGGIAIILVLCAHIFFRIFDVRVFVFGVLSVIFIFRSIKARKPKKKKQKKEKESEKVEEPSAEQGSKLSFQWNYKIDPLQIQKPVSFSISVSVNMDTYNEYQAKDHLDNSPAAIRQHVRDGISPEIADIAMQIKKLCASKEFNTFHQVSAVMAFQQSLKYVMDIDSKQCEEYLRYPLETIVDGEGDCDCHAICSAAILSAMGYDVVMLRILFPDSGHLALAVEGADGIPGDFFRYNDRPYYYCEVTPGEENGMAFKVGEMPDMSGADITIVPVKEIVSNS